MNVKLFLISKLYTIHYVNVSYNLLLIILRLCIKPGFFSKKARHILKALKHLTKLFYYFSNHIYDNKKKSLNSFDYPQEILIL